MNRLRFFRKSSILQPLFTNMFETFKNFQDASKTVDLQLGAPNGKYCMEFHGKVPDLCDINKANTADLRGQIPLGF